MSYFSDLGLAEPILRALEAKGYNDPTPIQRDAIPALLQGRDLLGIAQTGTGKTAAFALPSLHRLAAEPKGRQSAACRMLVLSPTRELAAQIAENMRGYARYLNLSVQCVFGGIPVGKQARALVPGCDVLVATPGRLLDLIEQRALTLRHVEIFVLDEADQMMDLGFIVPLKRISSLLPKERQSLFFSATMPKAIAELGKQFISNPVRVEVTPQATTAERVEQFATFINQAEKQSLLSIRLRDGLADGSIERALVFARTKHGSDRVVRHLATAGVACAAIHGNKSQAQRTAAIKAFRAGSVPVLIATDIAARGIDIPGVSHVFNYEMPNVAEQYVHRIGRTARAGADGIAMSFVAPDEKAYLRDIEKLTGIKLMPLPLPEDFQKKAAQLPAPSRKPENEERSSDPRQHRRGRGAPAPRPQHRDSRDGRPAYPRAHDGQRTEHRGPRQDSQRPQNASWDPVRFEDRGERTGARPAGDRARPAGERSGGERNGGRPFGDRPFGDRQGAPRHGGERTAGGDRHGAPRKGPQGSGGQRPGGDRKPGERAGGERTGGERAGGDRHGPRRIARGPAPSRG